MDHSDEVQFIGLLDILQRLENKELFEKVWDLPIHSYNLSSLLTVFVLL